MKRILSVIMFIGIVAISAFPQSINRLSQRCATPYRTQYSVIEAVAAGDLTYTPCPTRSSIFYGLVDFTNATVTGVGNLSGTLTSGAFPYATDVHTLSDSPFTWDGTSYTWQSTVSSDFFMSFRPGAVGGLFHVGDTNSPTTYFELNSGAAGNITAQSVGHIFLGDSVAIGNQAVIDVDNVSATPQITIYGGINGVAKVFADTQSSLELTGGTALTLTAGNIATDAGSTLKTNKLYPLTIAGSQIGATTVPFSGYFIGGASGQYSLLSSSATTARTATLPDTSGNILLDTTAGTNSISSISSLAGVTNGTTTFATSGLSVNVTSGGRYAFKAFIIANNTVAAEGIKLRMSGGTASIAASFSGCATFGIAANSCSSVYNSTFSLATIPNGGIEDTLITIEGVIKASSTGTVVLDFAENSTGGGGSAKIVYGSYLRLMREN